MDSFSHSISSSKGSLTAHQPAPEPQKESPISFQPQWGCGHTYLSMKDSVWQQPVQPSAYPTCKPWAEQPPGEEQEMLGRFISNGSFI